MIRSTRRKVEEEEGEDDKEVARRRKRNRKESIPGQFVVSSISFNLLYKNDKPLNCLPGGPAFLLQLFFPLWYTHLPYPHALPYLP